MTERSLQVTYRKGRAFAAYLHLSRPTGEKSARTVASPDGLLIVDYAVSGRPLGVEITAPQAVFEVRLGADDKALTVRQRIMKAASEAGKDVVVRKSDKGWLVAMATPDRRSKRGRRRTKGA